eukprot:CAMPEP_0172499918 /NCGR_PEP_ID=MMETSP1066-20121228/132369_1 /TAXON_ID=671091 /ORGANISM="Coscinodiscus wailesii, Strain CCMP2513" /LENGTH=525 /DNA_ID=CAMNT_0013273909 /DNA_START=310 /DNA_END=1887 /DNA_ORIENTATION=-
MGAKKKKDGTPQQKKKEGTIPDRSSRRPPLYLQCSCQCKKQKFKVGPLVEGSGLHIVNCHCRSCRTHAAAAWATWLTKSGGGGDDGAPTMGFSMESDLEWVKGGTDLKIVKAPCGSLASSSGYDDSGDKYLCPECYSVLFFKVATTTGRSNDGEGGADDGKDGPAANAATRSDDFFLAMGIVDDGDYPDDKVGRVDNQSLWPSKVYPDMLRKKAITFTDACTEQRANWYIKQAKCSDDEWEVRDETFRKVNLKSLYKTRANSGNDANANSGTTGHAFYSPFLQQQSQKSLRLKKENLPEVQGSCLCGACSFEVVMLPGELQHCFCSMCRKFSGSAFQTWGSCENKYIRWMDKSTEGGPGGGSVARDAPPTAISEGTSSKRHPRRNPSLVHPGKTFPGVNLATFPKALKLYRSSDESGRHVCTECGTIMSIVYDCEGKTTTWLAAGLYSNTNPGDTSRETSLFRKRDEGEGTVVYCDETSEGNDESVLTPKYFEKRIYYVAHICCASLQPWFKIPNVGTDKIRDAC